MSRAHFFGVGGCWGKGRVTGAAEWLRQDPFNRGQPPCALIRSAIMPKFSIRLRSLRHWSAPLLEAATRTRGYPAWLMVGIKAVVTIGLLTAAAAWTMERSAKAHLAQLAGDAAKATPSKASRQR
jgi:hypothetical protein